jgi:hypothetical protein
MSGNSDEDEVTGEVTLGDPLGQQALPGGVQNVPVMFALSAGEVE